MTSSEMRLASLPMTFTNVRSRAPRFLPSCIAARVSTVSPDWVTAMTSCPFDTTGSRYRYSDAISTSHGIRASRSMRYFPMSEA